MTPFGPVSLCCPYCAGDLRPRLGDSLEFNILTCHCFSYPVIAGVPVLRRGAIGSGGESAQRLVALIEAGRFQDALLTMLVSPGYPNGTRPPAWLRGLPDVPGLGSVKALGYRYTLARRRRKAATFLRHVDDRVTACDMIDLYYRHAPAALQNAYNHFVYRFGQPRHLVALSLAGLIDRTAKPVLELACGFGHVTRGLSDRAGPGQVVALDRSFFLLYVARHWIAPSALFVCCEADAALPFRARSFSTIFCVDGLHYLTGKAACVREAQRVLDPGGLMVFSATRNGLLPYAHPGESLPPAAYAALFSCIPHRIVRDTDILDRYLSRRGADLATSSPLATQEQAALLSIVAGNEQAFREHGEFTEWPHARGRLSLNPLYVFDDRDDCGRSQYRRRFPTAFYAEDNPEYNRYLPEHAAIDPGVIADLQAGRRTPGMDPLLERCVLLGMPDRYGPR